jgi:hypothetical protein
MRRILAYGLLALAVAACGSSSGTGGSSPAGGTGSPSEAPAGTVQESIGTSPDNSTGGGIDLGGVDPAGLAKLSSEKVCTLLSADEAASILGAALAGTPSGVLIEGLGTNCIYTTTTGSLIKIEFNTLGYKSSTDLMKLGTSPQSFTIAGRPAMGLESAGPSATIKAQLDVSLSDDPDAVCLYVEAPTLAMAKQVGEKAVPRIASLK